MSPDDAPHRSEQSSDHPHGHLYTRTSPPVVLTSQQHDAQVAYDQAAHQYRHNPPNQPANSEPGAPYNQTQQPALDWQRYHSAWQQYYQQYYGRYYANQMLQRDEARPEAPKAIAGADHIDEPQTRTQKIKADLLRKVRERTEKARSSNRFVPILCAAIVALLFLALQFNRLFVAEVEAFISPGSTVDVSDTVIVDPATDNNISTDPKLIIPKINLSAPVNYSINTVDEKVIQKGLENGVVHYDLPGANSVPGQNGNGVILGHSSNDVFDPGNYKFAFLLLDRLQNGDLFYLNYQGKRYVYRVHDKKTIDPTNWKVLQQSNSKPTMILVAGTPVGAATNRLLVYGEQISPDPATNSAAPANNQNANPAQIPGNSQTFFERLYNLFF